MANGSFGISTSNTHIVGTVTWTESAVDNTNNYSDIYVEMRLGRNNTGYTSSGTDDFYIDVNGSRLSNHLAYSLTYNSNTLMVSGTVRVYHNADGTKSITIGWGGGGASTGVFSVNAGSGTAGLTTIPRATIPTSTPNWTMGTQNLAVTMDVKDASYHHTIQLFVQHTDGVYYDPIVERTGITGSSYTFAFTSTEITAMYTNNGMYENRPTIFRVYTYDANNNQIGGYQESYGTAYAIATSTITLNTNNTFNIGTSIPYTINNFPVAITGNFTFDLTLTIGSFTKSFTGLTAQSGTLTLTTTEMNNLYAATPNSNSISGTATLRTKYGGVYTEDGVPSTHDTSITALVTGSNPTFTTIEYHDIDTTIKGITGNDQYIVQSKSNFQAKILNANKAVAKNSATITKYIATLNGINVEVDSPFTAGVDVLFNFGIVNASSGINLTITAYDSRGNATPVIKAVNIVPYSSPVVTATALRDNGFLDNTVLTLSATISPLNVNGVNKNNVVAAGVNYQYRIKNGTYNAVTAFTGQVLTMPNLTATPVNLTLANTSAWDISVQVQDSLGSKTQVLSVNVGTPIMHIDNGMKNVGIGKFPRTGYALDVTGKGAFSNDVSTDGKMLEGTTPVSPTGAITMFAGSAAPTGWLLCQGQAVSRTTYATLFTAIGTTYGIGDGSTTFNLPNLKGKVPVGVDSGQTEFAALNTTGGEKTHLLTTNEMPSHTHDVQVSNTNGYTGGDGRTSGDGYSGATHSGVTTGSTGGGVAHNNLQPYLSLNFIIRT